MQVVALSNRVFPALSRVLNFSSFLEKLAIGRLFISGFDIYPYLLFRFLN